MTINERLQYIEARMKALFPGYATDIGRVRGVELEDAPIINVAVGGLVEPPTNREEQVFNVEILLKKAISRTNPADADRDLLFEQTEHVGQIRDMLRSSSFREGRGVEGFNKGPFGPVQDIEAQFAPRADGAVLASSIVMEFSVSVDNRYSDPDDELDDLESIGGPVSFDGAPAVETELYK